MLWQARQGLIAGRGALDAAGGGGGSSTTFDPADKSADITLSGGNLIATASANGGGPGVLANSYKSTGVYYCEMSVDAYTTNWWIGLVQAAGLNSFWPGVYDSNGVGFRASDGLVVYQGFTTLATLGAASVGAVLCMAVDIDNTHIWFRINGGNWNNNAGASPGVNTTAALNFSGGGFTGPYTPQWSGGGSINDQATANFGGSAYAHSVPSGFGNW